MTRTCRDSAAIIGVIFAAAFPVLACHGGRELGSHAGAPSPMGAGGQDLGPANGAGGAATKDGAAQDGGAGGRGEGGAGGSLSDAGSSGGDLSTKGITCTPALWPAAPSGWASVAGGTRGGGQAPPSAANTATSIAAFNALAGGTSPGVIYVAGHLSGQGVIGSHKTIWGLCGAQIEGGLSLRGSQDVVLRNLKIVGLNCSDSPDDCSAGADAVHVDGAASHLWFDHDDISDGSDGNLDITHGSDLITISWTKFHYSGRRLGGHQFCSLVGHNDSNAAEDAGHLNITYDHVWWADNIDQRMPRVRFGKVHVFNNLYTATGNSTCIGVGVDCNIRSEHNVFEDVREPVNVTHANAASVLQSSGNVGSQGSDAQVGGASFMPPYGYTLEPVASVRASVMAGAGPR